MILKINSKHTKSVTLSTPRRHPLALTIVTALGLAASASYMRTGYAGSCSGTGVNIICSGAAGTDTTQSFTESGPLTVTTQASFGLNTTSGNGFDLNLNSGGGAGDLVFLDENESDIRGDGRGISAIQSGSGALSITTSGTVIGDTSSGIDAVMYNPATTTGDLTINANGNVTGGSKGSGISASSYATGDITINAVGNVVGNSDGIYAYHYGTGALSITTSGAVTGNNDDGIDAYHFGTGALSITTNGAVTGNYDDGIAAFHYGYSGALSITTNGSAVGSRNGIYAIQAGTGALSITTSDTVTGTTNHGIEVKQNSPGDVIIITSGDVTGDQTGISVNSAYNSGVTSITVNGTVTGVNDAGVRIDDYVQNNNKYNNLTISTTGVIQGGASGAIQMYTGKGSLRRFTISNAGSINGDVTLSTNNDTFESNRDITIETSGVLNIIDSGTIDFGAGDDTFRNSGMIAGFAGALPTFTGLETFANNGEIRLKNDIAGNTLTINNNFVGEANSLLSVDANFATGVSDKLDVIGDVSGITKVNVNVLADGEQSVTVASVSGTSAASSFELADTGLFQLDISKEGNDFVVNSSGKKEVGGGAKAVPVNIVSGINEIFQRAIPSYHERNEGQQLLSDDGQRRVWLRGLYNDANLDNNDNDIDITQRGLLVGGDYQLQHGRIGIYVGGHSANSSVSNGDVNSHARMTGGFVGSYYSFEGDDWYGDAAFEWQHTRIDYEGGASVGEDSFSANVLGASVEAGKTVFSDAHNKLQLFGRYQHGFNSIDDAELNNTKIAFDNSESARASAGVYWSHEVLTEKTPLVLGVRGAMVRDFEQDNDIQVGGVTAEQRLGGNSWAELGVNVSYNLSETTLLTANVSGQLGSNRRGKGVSVGYLWTF